jgi:hypothetical protein
MSDGLSSPTESGSVAAIATLPRANAQRPLVKQLADILK